MLAPELHAGSADIRSRPAKPAGAGLRDVPDGERDRLAVHAEIAPARGMVLGLILGVAAWGFMISVCVTCYRLL